MIKTESYSLESEHDGLRLSVTAVYPEQEPRAVVQFAHGMAEPKERYIPTMEYLARNGYACVINDHRGHGASVRSEKDYGYFYRDGANGVVKDLEQVRADFCKRYPGKKCVLIGHSMGSLISRSYVGRYSDRIDGLILSGSPGFNPSAKAGLLLTYIMSVVHLTDHAVSPLLIRMISGAISSRYKGKNDWLSRNKENVREFENNSLCGFPFTINGYRNLLKLLLAAYDTSSAVRSDLPVHFMSGADDSCAPNEAGFEAAVENMKKRGCSNVTKKRYEGLRHEILNEGVEEVRTDLLNTLNRMTD